VNSLKGVSSRLIRKKEYPSIQNALWGGSLWSPSYTTRGLKIPSFRPRVVYFAGACGGAPLAMIKQYIEQQQSPQV